MSPLQFTDDEFGRVRQRAEEFYRGMGDVRCPYFQGSVAFNTEGFRHLLFKSWNRGRAQSDQFMRLKYLTRAPEILRLSRTVQGIQQTHEWTRRHRHGVWEKLMTPVTYFEFVAVIEDRRFKVVVKQLSGGEHIFWSLIPFWRQTEQGSRLMHNGDPTED